MQGQSVQVIDQVTGFIALALMVGMASYMGMVSSPKLMSNPGAGNPGEQDDLVKKFAELNPEAQRGALRYIKEMRRGYTKDLTKIK